MADTLIRMIHAVRAYMGGDGGLIAPQIELSMFALGILLIDFWADARSRWFNPALALTGTVASGVTVWQLHAKVASRGILLGFQNSIVVDPFFLFFAAIFEIQAGFRSEEHTSELSRLHLVCRLLLEKKKNTPTSSMQEFTRRITESQSTPSTSATVPFKLYPITTSVTQRASLANVTNTAYANTSSH